MSLDPGVRVADVHDARLGDLFGVLDAATGSSAPAAASRVKTAVIGTVPDRGGRVEGRARAAPMPAWAARRAGPKGASRAGPGAALACAWGGDGEGRGHWPRWSDVPARQRRSLGPQLSLPLLSDTCRWPESTQPQTFQKGLRKLGREIFFLAGLDRDSAPRPTQDCLVARARSCMPRHGITAACLCNLQGA